MSDYKNPVMDNNTYDPEELEEVCWELFHTHYEDETPFGQSVIKRALRIRKEKQPISDDEIQFSEIKENNQK